MITLNQFTALLNTMSNAHEQLKTFGEGDVWEIGASSPVQYPLMWVMPQPSSTAQKLLNMKFSLIFADIVFHDKSNEQDVLSDTQQIALDILAQLNAPDYADDFILDPNAQLTPFTEKFDNDVAGWKVDINIKVNYLSDRCAVPSTLVPSSVTPASAPVIVRNSDGSFTATYPSGSSNTLADVVIIDGTGIHHNVPAAIDYQAPACPSATVENSDTTYSTTVSPGGTLAVPDSPITDSDGSTSSLPATKPFVAKTLQQLINVTSISTIKGDLATASKLTSFIQALSNLDLQNLTSAQIQGLTSTQIANLTSTQVQTLTNTQIGCLSSTQIQVLINSQLANLTTSQLQYILGTVMSNQFLQDNLTIAQRESLNEIYSLQTGQTTSYATGDDGDLKHGRLTDFFTLKTNNIFGNTHRFTDENGAQTYSSNYVIDHATGLGWCTSLQSTSNWATAIASVLSLVVGGNTFTDFKLPNINELLSIMVWSQICLNYAPFNINPGASAQMWTSTTNYGGITAAIRVSYQTIPGPTSAPKSGSQPFLQCRKHF